MMFSSLRYLPAAAILLLCTVAAPSSAATLTFAPFLDDTCSTEAAAGTVTASLADGTCVPLTSTGASPEVVLGFVGAAYARAYCGPTSSVRATVYVYSDSTCSNSTLLVVRKQMAATNNPICYDSSRLTCSGFSQNVRSPSFPPEGFAVTSKCGTASNPRCDITGNTCADTAQKANTCSQRVDRADPTSRSTMILCDGSSDAKMLSFLDGSCSQSAMLMSEVQPAGVCKIDSIATCPTVMVPLPSPLPTLLTTATGAAVQKSLCDDNTCSTGCKISARKLSTCLGQYTPFGNQGVKMFCVNTTSAISGPIFPASAGSAAVVGVIYPDTACGATQTIGTLLPRDITGSCMSEEGQSACIPSTDLPYFSGAATIFPESNICNSSTTGQTLLMNAGSCSSLGDTSFRLQCPSATPALSIYGAANCEGTALASPQSSDRGCGMLVPGSTAPGSISVQCDVMFPTTQPPPSGTGAASMTAAGSVWSMLAVAVAAVIMRAC